MTAKLSVDSCPTDGQNKPNRINLTQLGQVASNLKSINQDVLNRMLTYAEHLETHLLMFIRKVLYLFNRVMKKNSKDNKRIPTLNDNELLNIDLFSTLSSDVIDIVYEEAQNGVKSIAKTIDLMQDRLMILLGWFTTAEISLIGVLVGIVASDRPKPISLILTIYGVVALAVILVYLVSKGLYGTEVQEVGDTPSHFLNSGIVESLMALESVGDQKKQVKIMQLNTLQEAVIENSRTNNRLVDVYRKVVLFVLIAAVIGAILLLVLSLVL